MCDTTLSVSTKAAVLINVIFHANVAANNASTTAKSAMYVYSGGSFKVKIASLSKIDFNLQEHQNAHDIANARSKLAHARDRCY